MHSAPGIGLVLAPAGLALAVEGVVDPFLDIAGCEGFVVEVAEGRQDVVLEGVRRSGQRLCRRLFKAFDLIHDFAYSPTLTFPLAQLAPARISRRISARSRAAA